MKRRAFQVLVISLFLSAAASSLLAQGPARTVAGDWRIEGEYEGRTVVSLLSLSVGKDGQLTGEWLSYWGVAQLKDIRQDGTSLNFVQVARFGDSDFTANFAGTVRGGRLEGTLTSDRGEQKVRGQRIRGIPAAAGTWEMTVKVGQREYTGKLIITVGPEGKLQGTWQSDVGEHTISDLGFSRGKLTFKRVSRIGDRQWESTFEGVIKAHSLSGTFKSDRGDASAEGKRLGAAAIGKWDMQITTESGSRRQVLKVNSDLSAFFGPTAIDRITVDGNQIGFKTTVAFGDRSYEMEFSGRLEGGKLTGELMSPRGKRKVEGTKRQAAPAVKAKAARKPARRPDVIYVPTPQHVVEKMLELAQVTKDDVIYDLGCGDGRISDGRTEVRLQRRRIRHRSKAGQRIAGQRKEEQRRKSRPYRAGGYLHAGLKAGQRDHPYLLPDLNVKLIPQLEKLKDGSRIVSHDFDMRGVQPDKIITIEDDEDDYGDHTIYLWTTPLKRTDQTVQ